MAGRNNGSINQRNADPKALGRPMNHHTWWTYRGGYLVDLVLDHVRVTGDVLQVIVALGLGPLCRVEVHVDVRHIYVFTFISNGKMSMLLTRKPSAL